jgi:hypothetical protein
MDIYDLLASLAVLKPYLTYISGAVLIASALAALMPAPGSAGRWSFLTRLYGLSLYAVVYHLVNFVAINLGHAKNLTAPSSMVMIASMIDAAGAMAKTAAKTAAAMITALLFFGALMGLTACNTPTGQAAAKVGEQLTGQALSQVETAHPEISPAVELGCAIARAKATAQQTEAQAKPAAAGAVQQTVDYVAASCTEKGKQDLTKNDQAQNQPDGGSFNWLTNVVLPIGELALKAAPLVL